MVMILILILISSSLSLASDHWYSYAIICLCKVLWSYVDLDSKVSIDCLQSGFYRKKPLLNIDNMIPTATSNIEW